MSQSERIAGQDPRKVAGRVRRAALSQDPLPVRVDLYDEGGRTLAHVFVRTRARALDVLVSELVPGAVQASIVGSRRSETWCRPELGRGWRKG